MVAMDLDEQDVQDSVLVEAEMSAQAKHEKRVKHLLKQGFRQFRVTPRGPSGFVLNYSVRHRIVELEYNVTVRKGAKGQRLKKPRKTTTSRDFPFHKLVLVVPKVK